MPPLGHTPSAEATSSNHNYPLPQTNVILCSSSCSLQGTRVSVRVNINKHIQSKLAKKASQKAPTSENLKKIRGSDLCSQHSMVNEELNHNTLEEAPEILETPAIPAGQMHSQ